MACKARLSDAPLTGVTTWGGTLGTGHDRRQGLGVGTVTSGVGGLGTGLVRLIVPSLRARVTPGTFPLPRLLVVLLACTWLSPIGKVGIQATTTIAAATQVYLRYDGEIATGTDNHALNIGVRMSW
jgi:hypothetical protein